MRDKPLILLVDDVDFFLEVEKDYLENTPVEIISARNGQQALETAAAFCPDLVYLDVNMPVMGGIECCLQLKQDPQLSHIPVIIVYAMSKEISDVEVKASGCDGILHKPIDRNLFLDLGRRFLPQIDRRLQRIECQIPVDLSFEGKTCRADAINISYTGMYLHSQEPLSRGDRMRIAFTMPGDGQEPVECWAEVAWLNNGFPRPRLDMPQGFGVTFKLIGKQQQSRIELFLGEQANQRHHH